MLVYISDIVFRVLINGRDFKLEQIREETEAKLRNADHMTGYYHVAESGELVKLEKGDIEGNSSVERWPCN